MGAVSDAFAGRWSVNLTGKIQTVRSELGDVRLVGMTQQELQDSVGYYSITNAQG